MRSICRREIGKPDELGWGAGEGDLCRGLVRMCGGREMLSDISIIAACCVDWGIIMIMK